MWKKSVVQTNTNFRKEGAGGDREGHQGGLGGEGSKGEGLHLGAQRKKKGKVSFSSSKKGRNPGKNEYTLFHHGISQGGQGKVLNIKGKS